MSDVIVDSLLDTLKLLPFLYLAYLLMEFLEHRSGGAAERLLGKSGKIGPLVGGLFGIVPQCGFSAAASGLYAGRLITTGTLIAVYLSTSDEMLPILISEGAPLGFTLRLLGVKLLVGLLAGFAIDGVTHLIRHGKEQEHPQIEEICEREHCNCGDHFALSALKHTLRISAFLLIVTFLLNTAVYFIGEERLSGVVGSRPILGCLLAALVGLIPNCASSVALTKLYLSGITGVGCMLAGLLVNAGVGLLVLFRNNRPLRDSVRILAILFAIGICVGLAIEFTPIGAWIVG